MLLQHVCSNQQLKQFLLPLPMIYEHMGGQSIARGCYAHTTAGSLKSTKGRARGAQELQFSSLHRSFSGFVQRGSPRTDKGSNNVLLHF